MHKDKPGALISFRGHTLMADEFHAFVFGLIGLAAASDEVAHAVTKEPHYFLGGLALSVTLARHLR